VTDAVSALIAENDRLLRTSGDPGVPSRAPSTGASIRPPTDDTDRAAVEAFLRREKGFLQNLGGLVQEHAEELRSMVRATRQSAPLASVAEAPATAGEPEEPDAPPEIVEEAGANDHGSVTAADPSSVASGEDDDDIDDPEDPESSGETAAEEPIRIDDPEPARSGRKDEKEEGSLKELFWGEE